MHTYSMKTQALLQALLDASGLNPNSLSKALKGESTQPQIHKFLKGAVKEPKRRTLQPVADFFGVSVEVFFQEELAEKTLEQLNKGELSVSKRGGVQVNGSSSPTAKNIQARRPDSWPFASITAQQWMQLDSFQRGRIEGFVQSVIEQTQAGQGASDAAKNDTNKSIAQQVLTKKLTTESSDIYKQGTHQHADGFE